MYAKNIKPSAKRDENVTRSRQIFSIKLIIVGDVSINMTVVEQPEHMIDMVIILSVNFCPCKIKYQVKNLCAQ